MMDSIPKHFCFILLVGKPYLMVMKQVQYPNLFFFFSDFNFHYFQTISQPTSDNKSCRFHFILFKMIGIFCLNSKNKIY